MVKIPITFEWINPTTDENFLTKGRKPKPIEECKSTSVRGKLVNQFRNSETSSEKAKLLYQSKLHKGKCSVSQVIGNITPSAISHIKFKKAMNNPPAVTTYTPTEAVALLSKNKLPKVFYQNLRNGAKEKGDKNLYPKYHEVKKEKQLCYADYSVTETEARVNL